MSSLVDSPRSSPGLPESAPSPTRTEAPASAPRRIEEQARRRPNATALSDGRRRLTFAELDALAGAFAAELAAAGAAPEVPVAVFLADPIERTVASLAAWKAGAAYLPVDPRAPRARLSFVLADCGAPLLVAGAEAAGLAVPARVLPFDLDALRRAPRAEPPKGIDDPRRLAYVIYTSGSTGEPKGVEVEHGSLANLIAWHGRAFGVGPGDRASQIAHPAFDAAVWELWPSLAHGASVHFPDEALRPDPPRLRDWIVSREITVAFAPTPVAERLLELDWPARGSLRVLLTGGDALRRRPSAGVPFRLVNNYGPTEATVVATSGTVVPSTDRDDLPSIGRPIDGVEALVLDESGRRCGDGEPGELCLGGAGLARGYVGGSRRHPGGFEPHPFRPGARVYRTGDRVRRRGDGRIEFLGRVDAQVKIRGFRVEPAEIESAIAKHPAVRACLVAGRAEPDGEKRIVGYLLLEPGAGKDVDLRAYLRGSLPDYMIPAAFVALAEFPLTAHGKVDRDALPAPPRDSPGSSAGRAPATPVEARMAAIAADLLRLDRVGADENFFAIGGHSLLGTQMIARVREAFGVELALRTIFEAPTVADLSAEIDRLVRRRVEAMTEEEARRLAGAPGGEPA